MSQAQVRTAKWSAPRQILTSRTTSANTPTTQFRSCFNSVIGAFVFTVKLLFRSSSSMDAYMRWEATPSLLSRSASTPIGLAGDAVRPLARRVRFTGALVHKTGCAL